MDLDSVADALYALPPEQFTAARDAAAGGADDPALKKAVKALRRPTVSAHVVNRLVRDEPEAVDELLALGEQMRAAMANKSDDVRRLSGQRRELVGALVAADLTANVRDEVTATLEAATADPQLAAAVRSGRLVKPLRYAGFGAMPDLDDAVATALPTRRRRAEKTARRKPAGQARQTRAQPDPGPARELTAMRQRVLELSGAADDAQRRYDEAAHAAVEARSLLDRAEAERAAAHKAARAAHAEAEKARRELGRLERS